MRSGKPRERYLRHLAEAGARQLTLLQIELDQVRLLHLLGLREDEKVTIPQIEDKDLMAFLNSY